MWEEAEEFLKEDKHLKTIIVKHGSCSIKKRSRKFYFDDIASSIIEQQLSGKAAETIYNRVKVGVMGDTKKLLTPEAILTKKDKDLRSYGMSWGKASYLKDLSEKVNKGQLNLHSLDKLDDEEVISKMVEVKGIGRWTAEMFLMFTLARPDIFPLDDLGIKNGMKKILKRKMDRKKMDKFALRWKPYRTIASWYIWKSLGD